MATITLGIGSSHAPQMALPPDQWGQRAGADRRNKELIYQGKSYDFEQLNELREGAFADQLPVEMAIAMHARARAGLARLGEIIRASGIDVLVIVSSDHKETFSDEFLAPFTVFWGDSVAHEPFTQASLDAFPPGLANAEIANVPKVSEVRRTHAELALHILHATQDADFDPAASKELPIGEHGNRGIPHGWGYVLQQVLGGEDLPPVVPVFVNTFWAPNPPTAKRSYDFGVALGAAIESYPEDIKVGVVASGGLSHFVIDEELDRGFLAALAAKDIARLTSYSQDVLRSGTSELRSWLVVAGALATSELQMDVIDYIPAYRSEAGTGAGLAFVSWE
jgi:3-O-methylgallate 3,4-dioxygenase